MISLLINLIILVIIAGLIYWIVTLLPIPQPFKNVAIVLVLLIFLVVLLSWLTGYAGPPFRIGALPAAPFA